MEIFRKVLPVVGLILIAVGLALFGIYRAEGLSFQENSKLLLAAIVAGAGVLITLLSLQIRAFGPNLKYYASYGLTGLFVVGCLVMVYLLVQNHSIQRDFTEQKLHSLHPRTEQFLKGLEREITITAFPRPGTEDAIEDTLERYSRATPNVQTFVLNLYKHKLIAQRLDENIMPGDIFIETGERPAPGEQAPEDYRKKKISAYSPQDLTESELTNAIVEVVRPERITVYFLEGHGEIGIERGGGMGGAQDQFSLSTIAGLLRDQLSFEVKTLPLIRLGYVPDDCTVLVSAGPQNDLFPLETQAIAEYLERGGRALFLLDPNESLRVRFEQWQTFLEQYGVRIAHNVLLERTALTAIIGDPMVLFVGRFGSHPIVNNLRGAMLQMSHVRPVEPIDDPDNPVTVTELLFSSEGSWLETVADLRKMEEVRLPSPDEMKAYPVAVAVSKAATAGEAGEPMRMVVIGDADAFEDRSITDASAQLFVNAVNWLTAREDLIDIPTRELEDTPIFVSAVTLNYMFYGLVLGIPALILFGGLGYVFVRRQIR